MSGVNLDSFRAMMGKYNLGSIELSEGENGESRLTKVDNHRSWLLGKLFNASKAGEGSHVGANFAARRALFEAFRNDIAAKYAVEGQPKSDDEGKKAFLKTAESVLLGEDSHKALSRTDVVAKLLNLYDGTRLSWKPLSGRSVSAVAEECASVLSRREKAVSDWAARTLRAYADGLKPLSGDDLDEVAFLAGISKTEVETLLKTRRVAVENFLRADVRLAHLNNPPPEMRADLDSGKITDRQIALVALQRAIYYVKTGDVPDDLKRALGLDVPPPEPAVGQHEPVELPVVEAPPERQEVQAGPPDANEQVEELVEQDVQRQPAAPKDPIEYVANALTKLEESIGNAARKAMRMRAVLLGHFSRPYSDQIAAACEDRKAEIEEGILNNTELIKNARADLEALRNKVYTSEERRDFVIDDLRTKNGGGEPTDDAVEDALKDPALTDKMRQHDATQIHKSVHGQVQDGCFRLDKIKEEVAVAISRKAREIYNALKEQDDPASKRAYAKMRFFISFFNAKTSASAGSFFYDIDNNVTLHFASERDFFDDREVLRYPLRNVLNTEVVDSILRELHGIPPDSPIPEELQTPEALDTLFTVVQAFRDAKTLCRSAGSVISDIRTEMNGSLKGLTDVLKSGALNGVPPKQVRFFLSCCMLGSNENFSFGCGSNASELMANLTRAGLTPGTLPRVNARNDVEASVCISFLKKMNGGSLNGLDAFCRRVFGGRSGSALTRDEVKEKYRQWRSGTVVDPLLTLPKPQQEAVKLVKGELTFFEQLGKGSDAAVKRNMTALMDVLRSLTGDGKTATVAFKDCSFTLAKGENGALAVTVGKPPHEVSVPCSLPVTTLLASLENDLFVHAKDFGLDMVFPCFPRIGDESPSAREKFLRVAVAFAGVNALELSRVPTGDLAAFANALARGENPDPAVRFAAYLNSGYKLGNQAEIEETLQLHPVGGAQANGDVKSLDADNLYDVGSTGAIRAWEEADEVEKSTIVFRQPPKTDKQKVHDFIADLVLDREAWKYDALRGENGIARIRDVFLRHLDAVMIGLKAPKQITAALDVTKFGLPGPVQAMVNALIPKFEDLREVLIRQLKVTGSAFNLEEKLHAEELSALTPREASELTNAFAVIFAIAGGEKMPGLPDDRQPTVDDYIGTLYPDEVQRVKAQQKNVDGLQKEYEKRSGFAKVGYGVRLLTEKGKLVEMERPVQSAKAVFLALGSLDRTISDAADKVADIVQEKVAEGIEAMLGGIDAGKAKAPVWKQSLADLQQAGLIDPNSGYGAFLKNAAKVYFAGMTADDRRQLLASGIRFSADAKDLGDVAGAFVKGLGPLMLKILQGIPPSMVPKEFQGAFKDIKNHLAPIPEEYVKAQLLQLKRNSGGKISSIEVKEVLGAATVGEVLLCRVKTVDNPFGEEVVVKILRPEAKTRLLREEKVFKAAARAVGEGMAVTYDGQLARIKEEFDFLLEADNVVKGKAYDQPVYNREEPNEFVLIHSMKLNPLCTPSTDVVMLAKAPGVSVNQLLDDAAKEREKIILTNTDAVADQKTRVFKSKKAYREARLALKKKYDEIYEQQRRVMMLAAVWVEEAIFRGGFFHGDLHAGNMLVDKVAGVTVIDYGNATKLSKQERTAMMRMSVYAGIQEAEKFLDTFIAILTPAGVEQVNRPGVKARLLEDFKELFAKGTGRDVAGRMFGAIALIQRANIETPPSIYNFMQSMMRLAGTLDSMTAELDAISDELDSIRLPKGVKRVEVDFESPFDFMDAIGDRLSISRLIAFLPALDSLAYGWNRKSIEAKLDAEIDRRTADVRGARNDYVDKFGGPSVKTQLQLDAKLGELLFPRKFLPQIGTSGWTSKPEAVKTFKEVFAFNFADLIASLEVEGDPNAKRKELRKAMGYALAHHLARYPELAKAVKALSPDSFVALKRALAEKNPADANDVAYGQTAVDFLDALLEW